MKSVLRRSIASLALASAACAAGCAGPSDDSAESIGASRQPLTASDLNPPSTLLPPGSTSVAFSMKTSEPATCRYSVAADAGYAAMKPFSATNPTTDHAVTFEGLSSDPLTVNNVFVRCDTDAAFVLPLKYRSLSTPNPSYPRVGNLWGWWGVFSQGAEHAARIDLFLGANPTKEQVAQLRQLNPNILVLTSINTVEEGAPGKTGIPESYYLKDTTGKLIEVWPGAFRVNIAKPEVARFKAQEAYKTIEDTGFMADGCFFDNFLLMPSWLTKDMWGNPIQVDTNEDGIADDPAEMDAAWRKGAIQELTEFRKLMPDAYVSGHAIYLDAEVGPFFNGEGIGFDSSNVIEGEQGFPSLWKRYQDWWKLGRQPVITMLESSTRDDIAYGFSYEPYNEYPASTLEFARTYYPDMRFGLAFTLMGDGFFSHEIGDTWHGNDWWYDELDHDLGEPCGPAAPIDPPAAQPVSYVDNGGFEQPLEGSWSSWVNAAEGAAATVQLDSAGAKEGTSCVRADVTQAGAGVSWHVAIMQVDRKVEKGKSYDLVFWAKADAAHEIGLSIQKGSADWDNYGLGQNLTLTAEWAQYTASFEATATASDARLSFNVGTRIGTVWIDDVKLVDHPRDVMVREFTKGKVILNATRQRQSVEAGLGFAHLAGDQAPRVQYLIDDDDPAFAADAAWNRVEYDSKEWTAVGPFYHDWGPAMHRLDGAGTAAEWSLDVRGDDTYTIQAWWPGGPDASGFSNKATYEVLSAGSVAATRTLDQTTSGNEWHTIAEVPLSAASPASVRVRNEGQGAVIADALHVFSKSRLNDGKEVGELELPPMDGIVLRRVSGQPCVPAAGGSGGSAGAGADGGPDSGAAAGGTTGDSGLPSEGEAGESDDGGCGCRVVGGASSRPAAWTGFSLALLGSWLGLRRRARPRRRGLGAG